MEHEIIPAGEDVDPSQALQAVAPTPAVLLSQALEKGLAPDMLEKFMDLQDRHEEREAKKAFTAAMSKFRGEVPTIVRNKPGHTHVYASLDQITSVVNPILAKHGLSYAWATDQDDLITVTCNVTHILGHTQSVTLRSKPETSGSKNDIQAIGSAVSYLQRYTLLAALGLSTGESDDDGAATRAPAAPQRASRSTEDHAQFNEWFAKALHQVHTSVSIHELKKLFMPGKARVAAQGTDAQMTEYETAKNQRFTDLTRAERAAKAEQEQQA